MVTWKEVHVQEEMRKVRMAQAEQARMMKAARAENKASASQKKKPYLLLLGAVTRLVKWSDSLRERNSKMTMVSREQSSQSSP